MSLKTKPLDRDAIKLIAIVLMLGNHIAAVFLPLGVFPWQIVSDLGYFTAITMCCFLVEGYRHTRSTKNTPCGSWSSPSCPSSPGGWPW